MPSEESKSIRQHIHKETGESDTSLGEERRAWIDYAKSQSTHPNVELLSEIIDGIPCLWLTPSVRSKDSTILYIHGGGLVDGAIITHREFVSRLVAETGYRALMIEYRLAPEHKFPAALDDVVRVFESLSTTEKSGESQLILGGDTSGGGLVISAMVRLRKENKKLPRCAFTISGVFDMTLSGNSMESRNDLDPCLSHEALIAWTKHFADQDLSDEHISPLFAALQDLPPILLQVGDHEVWLDDSLRFKKKIDGSKGYAKLSVWESMWHVWPMYSTLPEAAEALREIGAFIDKNTMKVPNPSTDIAH
ncbi:alpha/beta hydrolase fold domain protein [Verrucomicrobiia bacterium DG1235]|nr:alpha/beta hydrolase fold domain protein [Verrucomicrobiae bacterium DG1235]